MADESQDKTFYSSFQNTLVKASEEDGKWRVYLEASNEFRDQQDERIVQKALEDALPNYLRKGVLSWDHKHKETGDPQYIIGEPEDVAFSGDKTLVKGFLYKHNKNAQSVFELLMSETTRLGSSVGGFILDKAAEIGGNLIRKIIWDETAITYKPVNDYTLGKVQIAPFEAFAKALMAGGGVDASSFTGGRALTGESLQGDEEDRRKDEVNKSELEEALVVSDLTDLFDGFFKLVNSGEIVDREGVTMYLSKMGFQEEAREYLTEFMYDKVSTIKI